MKPTRLVLDTSAYARFRVGHAEALDAISASATLLLPTIVLGELEAGFRRGTRLAENLAALSALLAEPYVTVLPVTANVARIYALVVAELRLAGTPIPTNDLWIAATTIEAGAHLLTFDADFAAVRRLDCTILEP